MEPLRVGDTVRIDIPDTTDPDHDIHHGKTGEIIEVASDDASSVSGDRRDDAIYRVRLDGGEIADFRWRDLRPLGSH